MASLLVGLGTWLLTVTLGHVLAVTWERVRFYRLAFAQRALVRYEQGESALPEHLLYDYPDLPWQALGVGLALAGFLGLLLTVGWPYALFAVALERAPWLIRQLLRNEGKQRLRLRVRDLVDDLRQAEAVHGSLGRALPALAEVMIASGRRDAVATVLVRHAPSLSVQVAVDEVLRQMAEDLRSDDMRQVADQVRLALASGLTVAEALSAVTANLSDVIAAEVNVRLQAAPNTYVLPMIVFMFGPLLVLVLLPLVLRITAMLAA
jgi:hypothetical protein